jgi:hypothetical protein
VDSHGGEAKCKHIPSLMVNCISFEVLEVRFRCLNTCTSLSSSNLANQSISFQTSDLYSVRSSAGTASILTGSFPRSLQTNDAIAPKTMP